MEQVGRHSQHKVLLPAWLAASHGDGRALNILHLQGHVRVKFLCKKKSASAKTLLVMLLFTGKHPNFGLPIKKKQVDDAHGSQLTLWSIELAFLHCKHREKMDERVNSYEDDMQRF